MKVYWCAIQMNSIPNALVAVFVYDQRLLA